MINLTYFLSNFEKRLIHIKNHEINTQLSFSCSSDINTKEEIKSFFKLLHMDLSN